jgi:hypothetical protein
VNQKRKMNFIRTSLHIFRFLIIVVLLTVLTQIGGLIYLLLKPLGLYLKQKKNNWKGFALRMTMYFGIYLLVSVTLIPRLARQYNRVPLPCFSSETAPIKPARYFFWIANRHYVRTELYDLIIDVSNNINTKYPNIEIQYLDANFPLFKYFPLLPHKSHNDGRRLDICFLYKNKNGEKVNVAPGVLGYGHCEQPRKGEVDYPERCRKKGYRLYSMLYHLTKNFRMDAYLFDKEANRVLLKEITKQKKVRKVFIEPHLKTRLKLGPEDKIRFHGCGAVRHDDHIHLEL